MWNEGYFNLCDEDDLGIRPMEGLISLFIGTNCLRGMFILFRVLNVSA